MALGDLDTACRSLHSARCLDPPVEFAGNCADSSRNDDGSAILLFDEADTLFGRRGEVEDSHDRDANIEIDYLLQHMESHRGRTILATNMEAALDDAFLCRLRFIVNFRLPGPDERMAIWRKAFPLQGATLDARHLARLSLVGGAAKSVQ